MYASGDRRALSSGLTTSAGALDRAGSGVTPYSGGKLLVKYMSWKPANFRLCAVASSTACSSGETRPSSLALISPARHSPPWVQAMCPWRLPRIMASMISCSVTCTTEKARSPPSAMNLSASAFTRGKDTGLPIMAAWATLGCTVTGA